MPQPTISNIQQKIEVDNIGSVTVTDIVPDGNGNFIREIRILGIADANNLNPPLVFTLRLTSTVQSNVSIATPSSSF